MRLRVTAHPMNFREPLRIAGRLFEGIPAIRVTLRDGALTGRGEAGGVFFTGDDLPHMLAEIERFRPAVEAGTDRAELRRLMPPGGARNAIDAALWELEARRAGQPVWRLIGRAPPRPLVTTFTIGADTPERVLAALRSYRGARALKLKLDGDLAADVERLRLIRRERPDIWLMADANQGYAPAALDDLMAHFVAARVALLEQPIARGREADLIGFKSPIPLAADESLLDLADLLRLAGIFQVANIKLDKCGGLTEALMLETEARRIGMRVMVGNMGGSSLAAAPAFQLGQRCDFVDLDGPRFLRRDRRPGARYRDGAIDVPAAVWGDAR
jgi:L-alanine-DL-glutamate epimerase-like enolase superfamily enzyme